jgi:hypothetical protein
MYGLPQSYFLMYTFTGPLTVYIPNSHMVVMQLYKMY